MKKEHDNLSSPTDTETELRERILNTQLGGPVDTREEVDAQLNNLGPKDTKLEASSLDEAHEDDEELEPSRPRLG